MSSLDVCRGYTPNVRDYELIKQDDERTKHNRKLLIKFVSTIFLKSGKFLSVVTFSPCKKWVLVKEYIYQGKQWVLIRVKRLISQSKPLIVTALLIFQFWDLGGSVEQTPINKPVGWNGITIEIEQSTSSPGLAKFSTEEHEALFPDEIIIENASWKWGNAYTIKPKYGHMKVNQLKPGAPIANLGTRPSTSGFSRARTHSSAKLNAAANNGNGNQGGNKSKAEKQFQKLLAQLQKSAEVGDKIKIKFEIGSKSLEKDVIDTSTDHQTWKKMLSLVKTTSQGNDQAGIKPHSIRTKSGQQFTSLRKGKARMYGLYVGKSDFVVYGMCHKNNQETVINKLDTISVNPQASIEPNSIDFDSTDSIDFD